MSVSGHQARGIAHFTAGHFSDALQSFRQALAESPSSDIWNDWASTQFVLGNRDEADAGFRLALEIDPHNGLAAVNLAALLFAGGRSAEAARILEPAIGYLQSDEQLSAKKLLEQIRSSADSEPPDSILRERLERFVSPDDNEQSYFRTHVRRYVATLKLLPDAQPGQKLLELGAAFHHVTPLLASFKQYSEVRCNDIWQGAGQVARSLRSNDATEALSVLVDNFDVQSAPWPYADQSFDVILFCEMLEHLHSDPIGVFAELNRVLAPGGKLVLTTPNLTSSHSVGCALRGESPYVYGKFETAGAPTDRHNREYTPGEVERLASAAGFETLRLVTANSWWQSDRETLRLLAARGERIALRGDNIFLLASKVSAVRDRYPEEFYLRLGTQTERRTAQDSDPQNVHSPAPADCKQRLLVIHELVPHIDQSGSDLRLFDVLKELRAQGHQVTLLARDWKNAPRYSPHLESLGIRVIAGDPSHMKHLGADEETKWSFEELLRTEKFHAAILFHWFWCGISIPEHYLNDIRQLSPETRIAILTDDRHGERERRAAKLSGFFSDRERAEDFETRELAAYRAADLVLYITEADRAHFAALGLDTPTEHLPMAGVCPNDTMSGFENRSGLLFLGNFENLANRDALDWLLQEIWPLVRKQIPDLTLYIAGNACPADLAQHHERVVSLGKVSSLAETFQDRLALVAPIRFGTGINTKNLQALTHGLPVITTSIGAEGLSLQNGRNAMVADSPQDFAAAIFRLCGDPALWQALSAGGRELVANEFSPGRFSSRIREILIHLHNLRPRHQQSPELTSCLEVERCEPLILAAQPANYRPVLRILAHWQRGAAYLSQHDALAALQQFRHIFSTLRGASPQTVFHRKLIADIAAVYRELGDSISAQRCDSESKRLAAPQEISPTTHSPAKSKHKTRPLPRISVLIPTFNRKATLALSLTALAFQTLPASDWEVIVVDDGSTDDTSEYLRSTHFPFPLTVLSQQNQGAGAARNAAVAAARGEYVLLCNDDTIASSPLLEDHLRLHGLPENRKVAVLGNFSPSAQCRRRALSFWINHSPFLFPQHTLQAGQLCEPAFFVTCNLSVRRQALLDAGNFDPAFRVAEDTEMGARLAELGYCVRFEPSAAATHEHSQFASDDLLRRASFYGNASWQLLTKHPRLLGDGSGPFGKLRDDDLLHLESIRAEKSLAAASGLEALRALDDFDIAPLWPPGPDGIRPVDAIIEKVAAIVPIVYWHYLFEHFLAAAKRSAPKTGASRESALPQLAVS